jgi:hypothetical protein
MSPVGSLAKIVQSWKTLHDLTHHIQMVFAAAGMGSEEADRSNQDLFRNNFSGIGLCACHVSSWLFTPVGQQQTNHVC